MSIAERGRFRVSPGTPKCDRNWVSEWTRKRTEKEPNRNWKLEPGNSNSKIGLELKKEGRRKATEGVKRRKKVREITHVTPTRRASVALPSGKRNRNACERNRIITECRDPLTVPQDSWIAPTRSFDCTIPPQRPRAGLKDLRARPGNALGLASRPAVAGPECFTVQERPGPGGRLGARPGSGTRPAPRTRNALRIRSVSVSFKTYLFL